MSPDGQYEWNGSDWVPLAQQVTGRPKRGFPTWAIALIAVGAVVIVVGVLVNAISARNEARQDAQAQATAGEIMTAEAVLTNYVQRHPQKTERLSGAGVYTLAVAGYKQTEDVTVDVMWTDRRDFCLTAYHTADAYGTHQLWMRGGRLLATTESCDSEFRG